MPALRVSLPRHIQWPRVRVPRALSRFMLEMTQGHTDTVAVVERSDVPILTPTRIRLTSTSVFLSATSRALMRWLFCIFLLLKLQGNVEWSWWLVFLPCWCGYAIYIPLQVWTMVTAELTVRRQIGPPPPANASPHIVDHYASLMRSRMKATYISCNILLVHAVALMVVEVIVCWILETGSWTNSIPFTLVFTPFWAAWVVTLLLSCIREAEELVLMNPVYVLYAFAVFLALKLDHPEMLSWAVAFAIPWMFFAVLYTAVLVGAIYLLCLVASGRVAQIGLLPATLFLSMCATLPQCMAAVNLVRMLDGNTDITYQDILVPCAASFLALWVCGVALALGLHRWEALRRSLLEAGLVWTAQERIAAVMGADAMQQRQQYIDSLSDEEVLALAAQSPPSSDSQRPGVLLRVGDALFKRAAAEGVEGLHAFDIELQRPRNGASTHTAVVSPAAALAELDLEVGGCDKGAVEVGGCDKGAVVHTTSVREDDTRPVQDVSRPGSSSGDEVEVEVVLRSACAPVRAQATAAVQAESCTGRLPAGSSLEMHLLRAPAAALAAQQQEVGVRLQATPAAPASEAGSLGDDLCIICYERSACCVLLECGHAGFCRPCAHRLLLRPPHECPACRAPIEQVVELELESARGTLYPVKR